MRRQIAIGVLPVVALGFVVAYLRMVVAERRVKRAGGSPTPPRMWGWTAAIGVVALVVGALVALLSGLANHSDDLAHSAMTGTVMLAPGLVLGLAVGIGRWLGSRTVWRRRARGLR